MEKKGVIYNIMKECYSHPLDYIGKETFRVFTNNELLLNECCNELVSAGYLSCKDNNYRITQKGLEFIS